MLRRSLRYPVGRASSRLVQPIPRSYATVSLKSATYRSTKAIVTGILGGVTISGAAFVAYQFYVSGRLESVQPIPSEWAFSTKIKALSGVNFDLSHDYAMAVKHYQDAINELIRVDPTNADSEFIDISGKSTQWLSGYADLLIRLGLAQDMISRPAEARSALETGIQLGIGEKRLRSQAAVLLGKYSLAENQLDDAETYFIEGLKLVSSDRLLETLSSDITAKKPLAIVDSAVLSEDHMEPLIQLGRVYVKRHLHQAALALYLSALRGYRNRKDKVQNTGDVKFDEKCYEAVTMAYISELVWTLGDRAEAPLWAADAYINAWPRSHATVECSLCAKMASGNAAKMYRILGDEEESKKYQRLSDSQNIVDSNPAINY